MPTSVLKQYMGMIWDSMCQALLPLCSMDKIASGLASFTVICPLSQQTLLPQTSPQALMSPLCQAMCNTGLQDRPHVISDNLKWKTITVNILTMP